MTNGEALIIGRLYLTGDKCEGDSLEFPLRLRRRVIISPREKREKCRSICEVVERLRWFDNASSVLRLLRCGEITNGEFFVANLKLDNQNCNNH